jgi:competence protein ComEC
MRISSFPHTNTRPCVPLVLALIIGLILGSEYFETYPSFFPWILLFFLLIFLSAIFFLPFLALWAGCGLFFVTGLSLMTIFSPHLNSPQVPSFLVNQSIQHLSGIIDQEPVYYPEKTRLVVRLTSCRDQGQERPVEGTILLGVNKILRDLNYGDPIRFVCRLRLIESYHNPGGYNFQKKMARKGIRVSGFIEDPELLVLSGPNQRFWPGHRLSILRKEVSDLMDLRFTPPFNGLAQALITGDQSKIPKEVQAQFSQAGVSHLLAFSGLNLTLVGGLSYYLFRFLFSLSETILLTFNIRKLALFSTFFPVLGYTLLAGMSPSAARALLMVCLGILALLLNKFSDLLNSLALAALILLLLSPDSLFLPSFQLSFLAVWAIGYLLPGILKPAFDPAGKKSSFLSRGVFYLWGTFCVSLVCQLATGPVVAWWFHQISLIGLVSNLILVPLSGILATPIGLLALVFTPISVPVSSLLFWIMHGLLDWTLWLTRFFAGLPWAFLILPRPGYGEIVFFYLTLIGIFHWPKIPKAAWWVSLSISGTLLFYFSPLIERIITPSFRATFLDVGHGSSILIEFPKGQKMLIDGGGSFNPEFDLGERVVGPFLWAKKITRLDVIVLTHPHPDHLHGLPFVLSKFKVKEIWLNGQRGDSETFDRLEALIREKKISEIYPEQGWHQFISGVRVEILHSPGGQGSKKRSGSKYWHNQNNDSLVLHLSYSGNRILLPADIEAETEKDLLKSKTSLQSTILQVPHHGSLSSSTLPFIEAVKPSYAVISGRPSPRIPLPHPEVIRRYEERGVVLFRTDRDGAIVCDLKSTVWKIKGFKTGRTAP